MPPATASVVAPMLMLPKVRLPPAPEVPTFNATVLPVAVMPAFTAIFVAALNVELPPVAVTAPFRVREPVVEEATSELPTLTVLRVRLPELLREAANAPLLDNDTVPVKLLLLLRVITPAPGPHARLDAIEHDADAGGELLEEGDLQASK